MPRGRKKKVTETVVEQENDNVESLNETSVEEPQVSEEWKEKGFSSPEAYEKFKNKFN